MNAKDNPPTINKLTIKGYKSIDQLIGLRLDALNVVIGANGAGKSNLVSFFRMLSEMGNRRFQGYVTQHGPVDGFFFNGPSETKKIESEVQSQNVRYLFRLATTADERLVIRSEYVAQNSEIESVRISEWTQESILGKQKEWLTASESDWGREIAANLESFSKVRVYHFHDTSHTSGMRRKSGVAQHEELGCDAWNLSAFLYGLRESHSQTYELIKSTLQRIAPYLENIAFDIEAGGSENQVRLIWTQHGSQYRFTAGQLSDGTIRFLCLVTALLQPKPPSVIVLDEPELGLHPEAISLLGGLIRSASNRIQVIVATQSPSLLSQFDAKDVITIDHLNGCSQFRRPNVNELRQWLEEYTLGEIWQKGIMHGDVQVPTDGCSGQGEQDG